MESDRGKKVNKVNRTLHWAWDHFYTNNQSRNSTTTNVWCKGCVNEKMGELRLANLAAINNGVASSRTDDDLYEQGKSKSLDEMVQKIHTTSCLSYSHCSVEGLKASEGYGPTPEIL